MIERCEGRSAYREGGHGVQRVAVDLSRNEGKDEVGYTRPYLERSSTISEQYTYEEI